MKENWGRPGMPPINVEVKHSFVETETDTQNGYHIERKRYWIEGHHVHMGNPVQGWSGPETEVVREVVIPPDGEVIIRYRK